MLVPTAVPQVIEPQRIQQCHPGDQRVRRLAARAPTWELIAHGLTPFAARPGEFDRARADAQVFTPHARHLGDTAPGVQRHQQERIVAQACHGREFDGRQLRAQLVVGERLGSGIRLDAPTLHPQDGVGPAQQVLAGSVGVEAGECGQAHVGRRGGHRARAVARGGGAGGKRLRGQGDRRSTGRNEVLHCAGIHGSGSASGSGSGSTGSGSTGSAAVSPVRVCYRGRCQPREVAPTAPGVGTVQVEPLHHQGGTELGQDRLVRRTRLHAATALELRVEPGGNGDIDEARPTPRARQRHREHLGVRRATCGLLLPVHQALMLLLRLLLRLHRVHDDLPAPGQAGPSRLPIAACHPAGTRSHVGTRHRTRTSAPSAGGGVPTADADHALHLLVPAADRQNS